MVYVDRLVHSTSLVEGHSWRYKTHCHLTADTPSELMNFATGKLGLKVGWMHKSRNGTLHYDLTKGKRDLALKLGAHERKTLRRVYAKA